MLRHEAPLVSVFTSYPFGMVEREEWQVEEEQDKTGGLDLLFWGVMPDTSTSTADAWNAEVQVSLVEVSKQETCGARVTGGKVDLD